MRRGIVIFSLLFVILAGVGIGVTAYNAGERQGAANATSQIQSAQANGQQIQVIHVVGDGQQGWWFPGFFLFPLFLFGTFFLIGGIFRGAGRWGGHGPHGKNGPGPWNEEGRRRFEERAREWHQHEHESPPTTPPQPAGTV
jgi:hypothetical protein